MSAPQAKPPIEAQQLPAGLYDQRRLLAFHPYSSLAPLSACSASVAFLL